MNRLKLTLAAGLMSVLCGSAMAQTTTATETMSPSIGSGAAYDLAARVRTVADALVRALGYGPNQANNGDAADADTAEETVEEVVEDVINDPGSSVIDGAADFSLPSGTGT